MSHPLASAVYIYKCVVLHHDICAAKKSYDFLQIWVKSGRFEWVTHSYLWYSCVLCYIFIHVPQKKKSADVNESPTLICNMHVCCASSYINIADMSGFVDVIESCRIFEWHIHVPPRITSPYSCDIWVCRASSYPHTYAAKNRIARVCLFCFSLVLWVSHHILKRCLQSQIWVMPAGPNNANRHFFHIITHYALNVLPHDNSTDAIDTGWRWPMGYLNWQVVFRKKATDYKALLRKMTCKDNASCGSSSHSPKEYEWVIHIASQWVIYIVSIYIVSQWGIYILRFFFDLQERVQIDIGLTQWVIYTVSIYVVSQWVIYIMRLYI